MKDSKNFDYIKNEFDKENVTAPSALNVDRVMEKLNQSKQKKIKFYQTKAFKGTLSAVACIAIFLTAVTLTRPYFITKDKTPAEESDNQQVLNSFTDIDSIKKYVKKADRYNDTDTLKGGGNVILEPESAYDYGEGGMGGASTDYSQTYKQVENVDEGDIIKNDGEYIYWYVSESGVVNIYNKNGDVVSSIDDFEIESVAENDSSVEYEIDEFIADFYIYNDLLVVNTAKISLTADGSNDSTVTHIYDVSNAAEPKETNSFEQSGGYISSRMIGSELYIASNQYIYDYQCKKDSDYLPYVCNGKNGKREALSLDCISYGNNPSTASYLVVSAINIETGEKSADTKAIFGAGSEIYCNEDNMYIAMNDYDWGYTAKDTSYVDAKLQIVKIKLSENNIQFVATGEVEGNINDQFSMDEKDGNLRVATTSYENGGRQTNNLYVLDENLKELGRVTGFAKNESVKAVRFIGDMAYVITYHQIDPLFVIDLSTPSNPQIKGEVEITGFSSLLVPVDGNTILGIGYDTEIVDGAERSSGIKLALFDITNPEKPQVLDSKVLKDYTSVVQYNHRALLVNAQKGYYAIPYDIYNYENNDAKIGAVTFKVDSGKILITNDFSADGNEYAYESRCTYIDDTMYVLDSFGTVYTFNME